MGLTLVRFVCVLSLGGFERLISPNVAKRAADTTRAAECIARSQAGANRNYEANKNAPFAFPPLPSGIEWAVRAPSRAALGMPVRLSIVVANTTASQISLWLPGVEKPEFDFVVSDGQHIIWNALAHEDSDLMTMRVSIAGCDSLVLTKIWTQHTNAGRSIRPGRYYVRGYLVRPLGGTAGLGSKEHPLEIR